MFITGTGNVYCALTYQTMKDFKYCATDLNKCIS